MVLIEDLVFLPETLRSSIKALQCRLRFLSEDSVSRPALFLMDEHCYACYEQLVWIKTYYYKNHRIYHFSRRQKITFFDSHLKLCKLPVLLAYGKPKHNATKRPRKQCLRKFYFNRNIILNANFRNWIHISHHNDTVQGTCYNGCLFGYILLYNYTLALQFHIIIIHILNTSSQILNKQEANVFKFCPPLPRLLFYGCLYVLFRAPSSIAN